MSSRNRKGKQIQDHISQEDDSQTQIRLLQEQLAQMHMYNTELYNYYEAQHAQNFSSPQDAPPTGADPMMVVYCPNRVWSIPREKRLFLAGPLSSEDWQKTLIDKLKGQNLCVFNPRRQDIKNFDGKNTPLLEEQSLWESEYFDKSNAIVCWISWNHPNSAATMLQLGKALQSKPVVFVGVHPNTRDHPFIIQYLKAIAPQMYVCGTLDKLLSQVLHWALNGTIKVGKTSPSGSGSGSRSVASS